MAAVASPVKAVARADARSFATIHEVPSAMQLNDFVLRNSRNKSASSLSADDEVSVVRIRKQHMTKVKSAQTSYHEKLRIITEEFPRLSDLHPFYTTLVNVVYADEHYNLALSQIVSASNLIDRIASDYCKMLKYGDSAFRCKGLTRAARGRMATVVQRISQPLLYLEQVRLHLRRLPSLNPSLRTLIIAGYPNVGKSSFVNAVSSADVDVQPYALATKSLFVGHFQYEHMKWQIIDSPGILDRAMDEHSAIEMHAISALSHLDACLLYFIDVSETCGTTIKEQCAMYHSVKGVFSNKPILIVCSKADLKTLEDLTDADRALIHDVAADRESTPIAMSVTKDSETVKKTACDMLCDMVLKDRNTRQEEPMGMARKKQRVSEKRFLLDADDFKFDSISGISEDNNVPNIDPEIEARLAALELQEDEEEGEECAEVDQNASDNAQPDALQKHDSSVHHGVSDAHSASGDSVPQIDLGGFNVRDFVDADVEAQLAALEQEEWERIQGLADTTAEDEPAAADSEELPQVNREAAS